MEHIGLMLAFHNCLKIVLFAVCIITIPTLIVGIILSVLQAATQVNEMSLTFIPKLITLFIVLFLTLPWLLRQLVTLTQTMLYELPNYLY